MTCPHIEECNQRVRKDAKLAYCDGLSENWSFENCFKYYDLGDSSPRKTPWEWVKEERKAK
jgi:hypothetical protein